MTSMKHFFLFISLLLFADCNSLLKESGRSLKIFGQAPDCYYLCSIGKSY